MDSFKSRLAAIVARGRETAGLAKTRFAASRAGIRWAALPPRTRHIAAGGGAGALVLMLLAGLVLGPLSGHGAGSSSHSSGAPGIAAASTSDTVTDTASTLATPSATELATDSASSSPSASPTPWTPDDGISPRAPDTLAKISDCIPDATFPVSSGGQLYVSCDKGSKVIAVDLATDKLAKTYSLDVSLSKAAPEMMFVDHGLWVSLNTSFADDPGNTTAVERVDLGSGTKTAQFSDSYLVDDVSGVLWMYDGDGYLTKVNPSSAKKSAWNSEAVDTALAYNHGYQECGSIWTTSDMTSKFASYFIRLNPGTGATKNFVPANPKNQALQVIEWAGTCWGVVGQPATCTGNCTSEQADLEHLGSSCIDMVSSRIGEVYMGFELWDLGGTLWSAGDQINQVEPFGGKQGRTWLLPTTNTSWVFDANGQVWIAGDNGLMRVNIPLDKMTPGPTPPTLTCPGAAASASPSIAASASASATATPAPTDSPTPTDTPTPTASASTTP